MVLARVDCSLTCVGLEDFLLLLHACSVSAKRVYVSISIVLVAVVGGEAALVAVDVRVTTRAIDVIVDSLARAALATPSSNVLGAHVGHCGSKATSSHCTSWVVHARETSTIPAHVRVSTCAIGVVDFGTTCTCQNAHRYSCLMLIYNFLFISINK